jgi:hypothetical protein
MEGQTIQWPKRQTIFDKAPHRKLMIEHLETTKNQV